RRSSWWAGRASLPRARGFRLHSPARAPSGATTPVSEIVRVTRLLEIFVALNMLLAPPAALAGRPLQPDDWYRFQAVSDLTVAPDGAALAYLAPGYDKESDESRSALWLADWDGKSHVQLTRGESVSEPRFSPDGRYISFLSARPADEPAQLW